MELVQNERGLCLCGSELKFERCCIERKRKQESVLLPRGRTVLGDLGQDQDLTIAESRLVDAKLISQSANAQMPHLMRNKYGLDARFVAEPAQTDDSNSSDDKDKMSRKKGPKGSKSKKDGMENSTDGKRTEAAPDSLVAVVLRLPAEFSYPWEKRNGTRDWDEVLPAATLPNHTIFARHRLRYRDRDIPDSFLPKQRARTEFWYDSRRQVELANSIEYRFESGLTLTSAEILYHSACMSLPPQWLPVPLTDRESARVGVDTEWIGSRFRFAEDLSYHRSVFLESVETRIGALLAGLAPIVREGKIAFFITEHADPGIERKALKINEICFNPSEDFSWVCASREGIVDRGQECVSFQLEATGSSERKTVDGWLMAPHFAVSKSMRKVVFHSWWMEGRRLSDVEGFLAAQRRRMKTVPAKDGWMAPPIERALHVGSQLGAAYVLERWRETEQAAVPLVIRPTSRTATSVAHEIHIDKNGFFCFVRRFSAGQGPAVTVRGFAQTALSWLITLDSGLMSTFGIEAKYVVSDSKKKREFDLKILKHRGVAAYLLLEAISIASDGRLTRLSEGASVNGAKAAMTQLSERLALLISDGHADKDRAAKAPRIEQLCSKGVVKFLEQFVDRVLSDFASGVQHETGFFTASGEMRVSRIAEGELLFLKALLEWAAMQSGGECFLKARSSPLTWLLDQVAPEGVGGEPVVSEEESLETAVHIGPNWWSLKENHQRTPLSEVFSAFTPLQDYGFTLKLDGQEIEELGVEDLKWQVGLNEGEIDWFEMHPEFFLKGEEIPVSSAERLMREGLVEFRGKLYRVPRAGLPALKRLERLWERLQSTRGVSIQQSQGKKSESHYRLPKSQVLEMLALRASGIPVTGGERFREICAFYDSLDRERPQVEIPESVRANLKPYQTEGVQWLLDLERLGLGGILADDMGLGKTLQTLVFLEILRLQKRMGPVLVVVPTSLTYNWVDEAARFVPEMPVLTFDPKRRAEVETGLNADQPGVLIVSYGLLAEHIEFFASMKFGFVIFDEAQNLKNISARRTTAARRLEARFKLALTGTPLENHFDEVYSLLDLVLPGSLGALADFRRAYVIPPSVSHDDLSHLRLKIKPLILRRTKARILSQLPEKVETKVLIPFAERQMKIYRDVATSWNDRVRRIIDSEGETRSQLHMLTALLRLRQVCSCPSALEGVKFTEEPPKLQVLRESLEELISSGESALVFTQFLETYNRVEEMLEESGIAVFGLHGGMKRSERERMLKEFNSSQGGAVMLMTLKSGGVGLNLTKANYVFHLEPWWNPAAENQATDRAHRIGQTKSVQVYRYIMRESVEEKIELLKGRKEKRFAALFGERGGAEAESASALDLDLAADRTHLSKDDFEYLLKLGS